MNIINLDNKKFGVKNNVKNGETGKDTIFFYHQSGDQVWAEYKGGKITYGHLLGLINSENQVEFVYHHLNQSGEIKTGKCISKPIVLPDGLICLQESWQWTCDDFSKGESELIEIK